uniref:Putative ovule protein n=1 Tax=Solanum chacoense TaxID=4108 RepID=A0A0V0HBT0_SOLCH
MIELIWFFSEKTSSANELLEHFVGYTQLFSITCRSELFNYIQKWEFAISFVSFFSLTVFKLMLL